MPLDDRYSRQRRFAPIGDAGQDRLSSSRVLILGLGALGTVVADQIVRSGVGFVRMVDRDFVELSNLQRQILHATADIGKPKVESAKSTLIALNPDVDVKTYPVRYDASNAAEIAAEYQFIVDGSDNFETKFLVNDTAIELGIAFSHAGIVRLQGQTMTVIPGKSACYRCLFKAPPPPEEILNCQASGILGAVAGTLGTIQATEAVKYLAGFEDGLLTDRLLVYDAKHMKFRDVEVKRDPHCASCGDGASAS